MNEDNKPVGTADQGKRAWTKPTLARIDAGEAEVFTRSGTDGQFTFS
jgi:hypothetical protein